MNDNQVKKMLEDILDKRLAYADFGNGRKTVTAAGTPEALSDQDLACAGIYLQALAGNTGLIYWGRDKAQALSTVGVELDIGAAIWIPINNLNKIWIDAAVSGEGVCWVIVK